MMLYTVELYKCVRVCHIIKTVVTVPLIVLVVLDLFEQCFKLISMTALWQDVLDYVFKILTVSQRIFPEN